MKLLSPKVSVLSRGKLWIKTYPCLGPRVCVGRRRERARTIRNEIVLLMGDRIDLEEDYL